PPGKPSPAPPLGRGPEPLRPCRRAGFTNLRRAPVVAPSGRQITRTYPQRRAAARHRLVANARRQGPSQVVRETYPGPCVENPDAGGDVPCRPDRPLSSQGPAATRPRRVLRPEARRAKVGHDP